MPMRECIAPGGGTGEAPPTAAPPYPAERGPCRRERNQIMLLPYCVAVQRLATQYVLGGSTENPDQPKLLPHYNLPQRKLN